MNNAFGNAVKTIVLLLIVYVVTVNMILWSTSDTVINQLASSMGDVNTFTAWHAKTYDWRGFGDFFDYLSTFPGFIETHAMLMTFSDVVGNFDVTGINVLDGVIAVFRVLSTPMLLLVTVAKDIVSMVKWLFGFVGFLSN